MFQQKSCGSADNTSSSHNGICLFDPKLIVKKGVTLCLDSFGDFIFIFTTTDKSCDVFWRDGLVREFIITRSFLFKGHIM